MKVILDEYSDWLKGLGRMRESSVEAVLFSAAKDMGGVALKIMPTIAGMPDRVVLLPGGLHYFVELKRSDTEATKIQQHRHTELAKIGHPVVTLHGAEEVRDWVAAIRTEENSANQG